jgi:hypothetical protein
MPVIFRTSVSNCLTVSTVLSSRISAVLTYPSIFINLEVCLLSSEYLSIIALLYLQGCRAVLLMY